MCQITYQPTSSMVIDFCLNLGIYSNLDRNFPAGLSLVSS